MAESCDYNNLLRIYGNHSMIEAAKEALADFTFTGRQEKDTIALQKLKEEKKLKASFYYDGKVIYPFSSLVKEIKRMIDTDSIKNISKGCYEFFYLNFDIAHYDIHGYVDYYDGSFTRLYTETLQPEWQRRSCCLASTLRIVDACLLYLKERETACTINTQSEKAQKSLSGDVVSTNKAEPEVVQANLLDLLVELAG